MHLIVIYSFPISEIEFDNLMIVSGDEDTKNRSSYATRLWDLHHGKPRSIGALHFDVQFFVPHDENDIDCSLY